MYKKLIFPVSFVLLIMVTSTQAVISPITDVVITRVDNPPAAPNFWLESITVGSYTVTVDRLVNGVSTGAATAQPAPYNDITNADDFDLNLFAGRANETPPTHQIRELGGQSTWSDTNVDNPDFFVFETGGNQPITIEAILPGGTPGQSVNVAQAMWGDTGLVITTAGPHNGQSISGVAFAITDLLDQNGNNLTNSSIIEGIQITSAGYDPSCFCAVGPLPQFASNPDPAHGAIDVPVEANLSWTRGAGALEDEVYFGTDPCALPKVADIIVLPINPPLYNPGDPNLVASTTYFWQIVEVNGLDRYEGPVWEFTTVRGEAQPEYPSDGALINGDIVSGNISTNLEFFPGATTVEYKGYFSEDYSKVLSRHADANLGPPPYAQWEGFEYTFWVGNPGVPPITDSLVRGAKYYWTVDSNDSLGNTFYGDVWEFSVQDFKAGCPNPPNEAILVSVTPLLSWCPGFGVEDYDIYIGTSWEDVNNAEFDPFNSPPEFLATRSEPNYQVVYPLPYNTKIYWRVDGIVGRGPPDFIPTEFYKGNVWCFTTRPDFSLTDPNLVGLWTFDMGVGTTAWDWSGHENHGALMGDPQWVAGGMIDGAMDFDGTDDYIWTGKSASDLGIAGNHARTVAAWVYTRAFNNGGIWDLGARSNSQNFCLRTLDIDNQWRVQYWGDADHDFTYDSLNKWVHFALVFDPPSRSTCYADAAVISEVNDATLNTSNANPFQIGCYGWQNDYFNGIIDDVRIYDYAWGPPIYIGPPPYAHWPRPYNGQVSVPVTTPLKWEPGKHAALHDVYFGTDKLAVTNATTSSVGIYKGRIGPKTLSVPLDAATLYYWRIDEVNLAGPDPCMWKGDTWMFRTVGAAGGLLGFYYHWWPAGSGEPPPQEPYFREFVMSRIEHTVDFWRSDRYWATSALSPDPNVNVDGFTCKWVGHVECPVDANYTFYTETDDGARLFINGTEVILYRDSDNLPDAWRQQGMTWYHTLPIELTAGLHDIEMHMYEHDGGAGARLAWSAVPLDPSDYPIFGLSTSRRIIPPIWLWPPLLASGPRPPDGATIDDRKPALEWIAGVNVKATGGHELYFSANFDDVNDRNPAIKEILDDPCRPYPLLASPLQLGETYYWLVDEVGLTGRWDAQTVWSFTISECLSIDNMEDYNDRGELREVWRDGNVDVVWGPPPEHYVIQGGSSGSNLNVSTAVGAPVNGATGPIPPTPLNYEAMVLRYDNDGFTYTGLPGAEKRIYPVPYFSEIEASTTGPNSLDVGQTWDSEGVKSLSLSFQGHPMSDGSYNTDLGWPAYTVKGRGRDIWGRHDEFYFLSQYPFIGDGEINVEVLGMDNTDPWAKAGVMIREKWTPYSKYAAVFMTPGQGVTFQYRAVEDGPTQSVTKPGVTLPEYVRLVRNISGAFEAQHSDNGFAWEDVNAPGASPIYPEIPLGNITDPNIYAGTAVTSHNANQTCSAAFNNVYIDPLPPNWVFGNIGTNDPEQLYVALSDGVNTSVVEHNDANAATLTSWQEWNIKLSDFSTVNLDGVRKVYIGLGDRAVPVQGGSGAIYIDDIRACPPRCIPSLVKPLYDIAQPYDCIVDEKDIGIWAADYLESGIAVEDVWATGVWTSADIGDVCTPGSFTDLGSDTFEISASGFDIWGTDDEFHYAYKALTGDGQITVRVVSILPEPPLNEWSKAGVMIRDTLDPNSAHATMAVTPNYQPDGTGPQGHRVSAQGRLAAGNSSFDTSSGNMTGPMCVRLLRQSDTFTAYYYDNGEWIELASTDIVMTDPVYIGMVVTAHEDSGPLATAQFDRVCSGTFLLTDTYSDFIINLKDYALIADKYLEEMLWPAP